MGQDSLAARFAPNASSPDYKVDDKKHYAEASSASPALHCMTMADTPGLVVDGHAPDQPVQDLRIGSTVVGLPPG